MGYGIGTRGESCFVADGGEIALGVARAACYATGEERRRLLASVRAYMGYRDSFRVKGGGVGVGWSATDFSKRPTVRLEKPALNHDEWIYLCFGGVGLAETVEPMVTLKRIKADR